MNAPATPSATYYIASLKHTNRHHEHILWWGPNWRGYTPVVGDQVGEYDQVTAARLNDGEDYIAIAVEAVKSLLSSEPRRQSGGFLYEQRGPVLENSRKNWNALIAASMTAGRPDGVKPKPEPFRGVRRAVAQAPV